MEVRKKIQARGEKIQANNGHMLIIRELDGNLYLFFVEKQKVQAKKRYKLEVEVRKKIQAEYRNDGREGRVKTRNK